MKTSSLIAVAVCLLVMGCSSSNPTAESTSGEQCPIHGDAFLRGPGLMPVGLTVTWEQEMEDALTRYPYVRHVRHKNEVVDYCPRCEGEVNRLAEDR